MLTVLRQHATVVFLGLVALAGLCIVLGQAVPEWIQGAVVGAAMGSALNKDKAVQ